MFKQIRLLVVLTLASVWLAGCATYGQGVKQGLDLTQQGQYEQAAVAMDKALDAKGNDRLLHYLELGSIQHLAGNYQKSNELFETAERIAEDLYTKRVSEMVVAAMTSPRNGPYRGNEFERVYINYYKALNYYLIAANAGDKKSRDAALQGARIEIRRIDMLLTALENEKGGYQEQADKEQSMFYKLLKIFEKLSGEIIDKDKLVFRQDAYANYMAGLIYENGREYDEARVAYQKAAQLYEQGYNKQYKLDGDMPMQCWFDTIRMMQKSGGWDNEWPQLAQSKLTAAKRDELKEYNRNGHVVVIQHVGMIPERKEMNLLMTADEMAREFVIQPVLTGSEADRQEQLIWFFMLYADKSIIGLLSSMGSPDFANKLAGFATTKRQGIGPMWSVAEGLGLMEAMKGGMRITVPYFPMTHTHPAPSVVSVDGKQYPMLRSENLSELALQQNILVASGEIQEAMAREAFKGVTAQKVAGALGGGGLLNLASKLAVGATSTAETRNWLLLPREVRIARVVLPEGEHQITLSNPLVTGGTYTKTVNVQKGEMSVWTVRSFANMPLTPASK